MRIFSLARPNPSPPRPQAFEKPFFARLASFLSLTCACLAVSGASCPWLSYSGDSLSSAFSLYLFKFCRGGTCADLRVDVAYILANQGETMNASIAAAQVGAEFKVAAAFFYLAFIFLIFSTVAGVAVMAGKGNGGAKLALSVLSALFLFIAEVTAANWVRTPTHHTNHPPIMF